MAFGGAERCHNGQTRPPLGRLMKGFPFLVVQREPLEDRLRGKPACLTQ